MGQAYSKILKCKGNAEEKNIPDGEILSVMMYKRVWKIWAGRTVVTSQHTKTAPFNKAKLSDISLVNIKDFCILGRRGENETSYDG